MNGRAFFLACLAVLVPWAANAHDYKLGAIHIDHPWARPTAGVEAGAAYLSSYRRAIHEPGAYHIMLLNLKQKLSVGQR